MISPSWKYALAGFAVLSLVLPLRPQPRDAGTVADLLDRLAEQPDEGSRESVLVALDRMPLLDLRASIERRAAGPMEPAARRDLLEVLGRCGTASDVALMLRVAEGPGVQDEDPVSRSLQSGLASLLARDTTTLGQIETGLPRAPVELRGALFRTIASAGPEDAVPALARIVQREPRLGALALAHLARAAGRSARPIGEAVLESVRSILEDSTSDLLPEAALAAGALEDPRSVPQLIRLTEDARASVRENALWALRHLSGLDLRGGSKGWETWWQAEDTWHRTAWPRAMQALASRNTRDIASVLDAIAGRRCFRHEIAAQVGPLLRRPDSETARLACEALRQLGSNVVADPLREARSRPEPEVRAAAERALETILGEDAPRDPEAPPSAPAGS